jgi:hypothetical protein
MTKRTITRAEVQQGGRTYNLLDNAEFEACARETTIPRTTLKAIRFGAVYGGPLKLRP